MDNISLGSFLEKNNYNSLFPTPITEEEITNVVLNMSNRTTIDCHNINMKMVTKCIDVIVNQSNKFISKTKCKKKIK